MNAFNVGIALRFPFRKSDPNEEHIFWEIDDKQVSKHKQFTVRLSSDLRYSFTVFEFDIGVSHNTSHGGITICLGLLGFNFYAAFEDIRHWHFREGRYLTLEEMRDEFNPQRQA